jgi:hypothetical protein
MKESKSKKKKKMSKYSSQLDDVKFDFPKDVRKTKPKEWPFPNLNSSNLETLGKKMMYFNF